MRIQIVLPFIYIFVFIKTNGSKLYLVNVNNGNFIYTQRLQNTSLQKYMQLPVKTNNKNNLVHQTYPKYLMTYQFLLSNRTTESQTDERMVLADNIPLTIFPAKFIKWMKENLRLNSSIISIAKTLLTIIIFKKVLKFAIILSLLLFASSSHDIDAQNNIKIEKRKLMLNLKPLIKSDRQNCMEHNLKRKRLKNKDISLFIKETLSPNYINEDLRSFFGELAPERIRDLAIFISQTFEAFTIKALICYGVEDIYCRFYQMFETMDKLYTSQTYVYFISFIVAPILN